MPGPYDFRINPALEPLEEATGEPLRPATTRCIGCGKVVVINEREAALGHATYDQLGNPWHYRCYIKHTTPKQNPTTAIGTPRYPWWPGR